MIVGNLEEKDLQKIYAIEKKWNLCVGGFIEILQS